jgi:phosphopantetheinyl transferase
MIVLPIPERWRHYAILVEQRAGDVPDDSMFLPAELALRDLVALPRRRREWTVSRTALKILAQQRGAIAEAHDGLIESDAGSRPHLRDLATGRSWCVSLSHSRGFAAAAVDRRPVGVDVEKVRPLSLSAAHLFLTDGERDEIESARIEDALLHSWCAKEAAWKAISSMHETLKSVPLRLIERGAQGLTFEGPALTIETRRISPDLVAALAVTV